MQLSVNLNKIALLRNAREGARPAVVDFARAAIAAGAYGVTVHPRPDLRHIRPHDVQDLAGLLRDGFAGVEYNIEGNPLAGPNAQGYPGFLELIEAARPDQATLVPDSDDQLTSDHGYPLQRMPADALDRLRVDIARCQAAGARVSLFMDPDPEAISRVPATGAERIELYTGPWAEAFLADGPDGPRTLESLAAYRRAAEHAAGLGLGVNAGHDLDLHNLPVFRTIAEVVEVSIGHALVADALEMGFDAAVRAYVAATRGAAPAA